MLFIKWYGNCSCLSPESTFLTASLYCLSQLKLPVSLLGHFTVLFCLPSRKASLWACRFQLCHRDAHMVFQPEFWVSPFTLWFWAVSSCRGTVNLWLASPEQWEYCANPMSPPFALVWGGWRNGGIDGRDFNCRERKQVKGNERKKKEEEESKGRVGDGFKLDFQLLFQPDSNSSPSHL